MSAPLGTPIRVALAVDNMAAEAWRDALRDALTAVGIDADVTVFDGSPINARYAVVWQPPAQLFAVEKNLRAVFNTGAGIEWLLRLDALPATTPLFRLVDAGMAAKMAEYVCFYLARITRGLHRFGPARQVDWNVDRPRGTPPMVGVMGLGAMGARVAQAAVLLGYRVSGWSRTSRSIDGVQTFAGADGLDPFLAQADILVNTLPLTDATRDLLDARRLALLPRGAHLINIGRGHTVVDADLLAALDSGHLASAILDVFRTEPLPPDHPFWHHPHIVVTPHLSAPTQREPAARQIAENIRALEAGAAPNSLDAWVDRARGY
jgi:glyoxylate/hydroxypyruvate reductase A